MLSFFSLSNTAFVHWVELKSTKNVTSLVLLSAARYVLGGKEKKIQIFQ